MTAYSIEVYSIAVLVGFKLMSHIWFFASKMCRIAPFWSVEFQYTVTWGRGGGLFEHTNRRTLSPSTLHGQPTQLICPPVGPFLSQYIPMY